MNTKILAGIATGLALTGGGTSIAIDNQINPYIDTGTKLEILASSTISEAGSIAVEADKHTPEVHLKKFNGEVDLGIKSLDLPENTVGSRKFLTDKVEWKSGEITMETVPVQATTTMEDGGMEINIILNSKPASNVFTFQLDNWQNLDFFYQPELTKQDMAKGTSQSDDVAGSYAVYYKNHTNHIEGQTNYATGKIYHIFRPIVTDAKGQTIWANLNYENGILNVTIPQNFLDSASYPVKVDPTFGYTTKGANLINPGGNYGAITNTGNISENGTVTSLSMWVIVSSGTCNFVTTLYDGANPNNRIDYTAAQTANTGAQLLTSAAIVNARLTSGTNYWNGGSGNSSSCAGNLEIYYDVALPCSENATYSSPPPATFTRTAGCSALNGGDDNAKLSSYITYTANVATVPINGGININGQVNIQ